MGVHKDERKNKWRAEYYENGKRIRRWFLTKGEALHFFNSKGALNEEVLDLPGAKNYRRLSTLIKDWYDFHGKTLNSGKTRLAKLLNLAENLGDPYENEFNSSDFAEYRKLRLEGKFSRNPKRPPKPATINREHSYLRAVFNELKHLGKWKGENPLEGVRSFKEKETDLAFLKEDEIEKLLYACDISRNKDLGLIVRVCLATGARWSEAELLTASQVIPFMITFTQTKSNKNRTVPISQKLFNLLPLKTAQSRKDGRLFSDAYESFLHALNRAEIFLPKGQRTHVLRHTFASSFMMNGGNILVLQKILGHSTIEMTMRYSHFAPEHLEMAIDLNPLKGIDISLKR